MHSTTLDLHYKCAILRVNYIHSVGLEHGPLNIFSVKMKDFSAQGTSASHHHPANHCKGLIHITVSHYWQHNPQNRSGLPGRTMAQPSLCPTTQGHSHSYHNLSLVDSQHSGD